MNRPERSGMFCGAAHPADPTILCALLSGHWPGSVHDDGAGTRWSRNPLLLHVVEGGIDMFCGASAGERAEGASQ